MFLWCKVTSGKKKKTAGDSYPRRDIRITREALALGRSRHISFLEIRGGLVPRKMKLRSRRSKELGRDEYPSRQVKTIPCMVMRTQPQGSGARLGWSLVQKKWETVKFQPHSLYLLWKLWGKLSAASEREDDDPRVFGGGGRRTVVKI